MKSILIRCDASHSIGSGHVMRCRNLARELQRRGAAVLFLCRRQSGDLIGLLEQEFEVLPLPQLPLATCNDLSGRELYEAWLGCTQKQDVADCLQALRSADISKPDWIVLDHYGLDASWECLMLEGQFAKATTKLFVIDDLANRTHQADLLLDQNFFGDATEQRYEGLLSPQCHQLLGPQYSLLGPEYPQLHSLVPRRTELRRVLVFFGGVDPDNLTCRTLKSLMHPTFSDIAIDVVVGHQSLYRNEVQTVISERSNTTLHFPLPSLAGLIVRADLSIGAGGSTVWERACLGLPSICIPSAENQIPISHALAKHNYVSVIDFDPLLYTEILLAKAQLYRSSQFLETSSSHCRTLTTGNGVELCANLLLNNFVRDVDSS